MKTYHSLTEALEAQGRAKDCSMWIMYDDPPNARGEYTVIVAPKGQAVERGTLLIRNLGDWKEGTTQ